MSIDRAKVSLGSVFEPGQAYVALSRMRTLEGLQVLDWNTHGIRADPKVLKFYNQGHENWIKEFEKEKPEKKI